MLPHTGTSVAELKANLFKGLSHPIRVRALELICAEPGISVTDMIDATGIEASHLSQHLSVLRRNHLVVSERRANQVFYRPAYPQVAQFLDVSRELLAELLETTHEQLNEAI